MSTFFYIVVVGLLNLYVGFRLALYLAPKSGQVSSHAQLAGDEKVAGSFDELAASTESEKGSTEKAR